MLKTSRDPLFPLHLFDGFILANKSKRMPDLFLAFIAPPLGHDDVPFGVADRRSEWGETSGRGVLRL